MKNLLILLMLLIAVPSISQHSTPFTMGVPDDENGMIGGITEAPIESWVFSNSSTLPTGSYDHTVNVTSGAGELNYAAPTSARSTSGAIRLYIFGGFPIDSGSERGLVIDFNTSSSLSGKEIVKATLNMKVTDFGSYTGAAVTLDVVGLIHEDLDGWTGYSTASTCDVSYQWYTVGLEYVWSPLLNTLDADNPDDGWTDVYPAMGDFWGVHAETTLTTYANDALMTFDVTEAVQAWAAGEDEGGFLLYGSTSVNCFIPFDNINQSASGRPYLEVYAR